MSTGMTAEFFEKWKLFRLDHEPAVTMGNAALR
jgi:hypothetical protein